MKHFLLLALTFALTSPAFAQEPPKPPGNQRAMYEDIEVMRTLLARQLPALHSTKCAACHVDSNTKRLPEPAAVSVDIPRPLHWGGFRVNAEAIELWVEGEFRIHERVRWSRAAPDQDWSAERLQP